MFYLTVNDSVDKAHSIVLDGYIKKEGDYRTIFIGDTRNGKRMDACVRILVKQNDSEALLEDLYTRPACDVNNTLTQGTWTHRLLMGALKFLIKKFTYIETIQLSDLAQKKGTRVYLTPKRLLLGQPGWYEEYFGAKPTRVSAKIIENVLQSISLTPEQRDLITRQSWGTYQDIEALSKEAVKLIQKDWVITRDTIRAYPIQIQVSTKPPTLIEGGGEEAFLKSVTRIQRQYLKRTIAAIQSKRPNNP